MIELLFFHFFILSVFVLSDFDQLFSDEFCGQMVYVIACGLIDREFEFNPSHIYFDFSKEDKNKF